MFAFSCIIYPACTGNSLQNKPGSCICDSDAALSQCDIGDAPRGAKGKLDYCVTFSTQDGTLVGNGWATHPDDQFYCNDCKCIDPSATQATQATPKATPLATTRTTQSTGGTGPGACQEAAAKQAVLVHDTCKGYCIGQANTQLTNGVDRDTVVAALGKCKDGCYASIEQTMRQNACDIGKFLVPYYPCL